MLIKGTVVSDGDVTLAELRAYGSLYGLDVRSKRGAAVVAKGSSRRSPGDAPNPRAGESLAIGRALVKLGKKIERAAHDRINGRAQRQKTYRFTNIRFERIQQEVSDGRGQRADGVFGQAEDDHGQGW